MARTIQMIVDEMVAAKNADTRLNDLNSVSATALWRLMFYVVAVVIFMTDSLYAKLKVELEAIRDSAVPGTPAWYRTKALEWQDGHVLQVVDGVISYPTLDVSARAIKRAAITEQSDGTILIKVAKAAAPLNPAQIASVAAYFRQIHFAGTIYGVISLNADKIRVFGHVYFDPQVGEPATMANIEAKVVEYLASLPFNAAIHVSKVTDYIQSAIGVEDVDNITCTVDSGTGFLPVNRTMIPLSGWLELDTVQLISVTLTLHSNV